MAEGLRTFSWRWSRSHSLALTVLYRTHPTERPFDALVVVPTDAVVDRDEHLVAGTFLPMPGMDGLHLHASEGPLRAVVPRDRTYDNPFIQSPRKRPHPVTSGFLHTLGFRSWRERRGRFHVSSRQSASHNDVRWLGVSAAKSVELVQQVLWYVEHRESMGWGSCGCATYLSSKRRFADYLSIVHV